MDKPSENAFIEKNCFVFDKFFGFLSIIVNIILEQHY